MVSQNPNPEQKDIIKFHHFKGETSFERLFINLGSVNTVSTNTLSLFGAKISMSHNDLKKKGKYDEVKEVLY